MKPRFYFFLVLGGLLSFYSLPAQELNKHFSYLEKSLEYGIQIIPISDGYLISTLDRCHIRESTASCTAIVRTNLSGDTLWTSRIQLPNDSTITPNGPGLVVHQDTIYYAVYYYPLHVQVPNRVLRVYRMDMSGHILGHKDLRLPDTHRVRLNGMIGNDDGLYVYGTEGYSDGPAVFIYHLDFRLRVLQQVRLGDSVTFKFRADMLSYSKGGVVCIYTERFGASEAVINRLDKDLHLLWKKRIALDFPSRPPSPDFMETRDGGFMFTWGIETPDTSVSVADASSVAIVRADSLANMVWEYIFWETALSYRRIDIGDIQATREGKALLVGTVPFYYPPINFWDTEYSFGWVALMSDDGELLWERTVIDTNNTRYGGFWSGLDNGNGYTLAGWIDFNNPSGVPFLNDQDIWFVTLDKDGCWNNNCDNYIVIVHDSTSLTWNQLAGVQNIGLPSHKDVLHPFPNPTSGALRIRLSDSAREGARRVVRITDLNGRYLGQYRLHAPTSTIDLSHLPSGTYTVSYLEDGQVVDVKKIIKK